MIKIFSWLCIPAVQAMWLTNTFIKYCIYGKRNLFTKLKKIIIRNSLQKKFNIIIGDRCQIGDNLLFPHPQNIVIGTRVIIGNNCIIYHDVTLGQNRDNYPILGDNIIIYPGAKIIGGIHIGDNVIVGANSVVTKDIPPNKIVAGIPAKVIGIRGETDEFY